MRNDLQFLEEVDNYLSGSMNSSEKLAFENTINQNAELKEVFETQRDLIDAAKRKALLAEIESVAAGFHGTSWIAANAKWILSVLVVGAIAVSAIFIFSVEENNMASNSHEPLGDTTNKLVSGVNFDTNETEKISIPEGVTPVDNQEEEEPDFTFFPVSNDLSFFPTFREFNRLKFEDQSHSQVEESQVDYTVVQSKKINTKIYNRSASFPDGNLELKTFVNKNLKYPLEAASKNIEGNVKVDFIVDQEGNISEVTAQCFNLNKANGDFSEPFSAVQMFFNKKVSRAFEEEALRMMELMPIWTYATNNRGKAIVSEVRLYFDFNYPSETIVYQLEESTEKKEKFGGFKYE
ncbi:MAG: energy transducer TonB [Crocinitomicaceae bacterium]|nr:energy transducer TonB [Crocinitomicaceae bacterium]